MNQTLVATELYESAKVNGFVDTLHTIFGNNIKTCIAFSKSACETSIDTLEFSVRASNALKRSGLMTVRDVIDAIADDKLLHIRNLGRKSYNEIKTRILKYGYDQLSEREKIAFFLDLIERNCS